MPLTLSLLERHLFNAALQKAVSKTLERKRRLGHYAVLWKDGKIVLEGEDAPTVIETTN